MVRLIHRTRSWTQIMTAFGADLCRRMAERGMSLHRLAKIVHYDAGYLCKVKNGHKPPSAAIAARVDAALGAAGALTALAPTRPARRHGHRDRPGDDATVTADAPGPQHHERPGQHPEQRAAADITLTLPCVPMRVVIEISEIGPTPHTSPGVQADQGIRPNLILVGQQQTREGTNPPA